MHRGFTVLLFVANEKYVQDMHSISLFVCFYDLFNDTLNDSMNNEWWNGKDVRRKGLRPTDKSHRSPQSS
jgi:hypothetical protein